MDERTLTLIDAYLDGSLTGAERTDFEQQLQSDPALAREVALQRDIEGALREPEVADLEEKLSHIIAEARPVRNLWGQYQRPLAIAASVLLLVGLAWLFRPAPKGPLDKEALFLAQAEFPEALMTDIQLRDISPDVGPSDSLELRLAAVAQAYQADDWQLALMRLDSTAAAFPNLATDYTSLYQYQRGILLLRLSDTEQAVAALEQVRVGPQVEAAQWYVLLGRLRMEGDTPALRGDLETLAQSGRSYADEAQVLLEALD